MSAKKIKREQLKYTKFSHPEYLPSNASATTHISRKIDKIDKDFENAAKRFDFPRYIGT